jgi:RNA 3'-terminal phosphate cyclase (ATP)
MSRTEENSDVPLDATGAIRQFVKYETRDLRKGLKKLPSWIFHPVESSSNASSNPPCTGDNIPVKIHMTNVTRHYSHIYIHIVAHTLTGFRVGNDALFGADKGESSARQTRPKRRKGPGSSVIMVRDLVERCQDGFLGELYDPRLRWGPTSENRWKHQPCVDSHQRGQLAVFEALGGLTTEPKEDSGNGNGKREDEHYWVFTCKRRVEFVKSC